MEVKNKELEAKQRAAEVRNLIYLLAGLGLILLIIIDSNGDVVPNMKVLKRLPFGLTEKAETAVRQWKFQPGTRFGEPVAVITEITVSFSIQ